MSNAKSLSEYENRARILIVDDEADIRAVFRMLLEPHYEILDVGDGQACLEILERERIDLILLDQNLPGISGLDTLEALRKRWDEPRVLMVSSLTDADIILKAGRLGAEDFIRKTTPHAEMLHRIRKVLESKRSSQKLALLESELAEYRSIDVVRSRNPRIQQIDDIINKIAKLPTTVLLLGESGTGKEVVARQIYDAGNDASRPFVRVNMASIPNELVESMLFGHEKGSFTGAIRQQYGKFELASGGVLFMDEIGELALDLQSKLLRVIQEGEFERVGGSKTIRSHVRLVAATNKDLLQAVAAGKFREDLYYRLNVVPIALPSLRDRSEDVPALAEHFVRKYALRFRRSMRSIAPEAMLVLQRYPWPGNIRELENLIERIVAIGDGDCLELSDIPMEFQMGALPVAGGDASLLDEACETFERNFIKRALQKCNNHRSDTAKYLGIPLSTLKYKLSKLNLTERQPV